jgi:hypothetical protein
MFLTEQIEKYTQMSKIRIPWPVEKDIQVINISKVEWNQAGFIYEK